MSQLKISDAPLSELGFAMKVEANRVEGDIMKVSKDLWLEIAERLMEQSKNNR